jgi:hypothetical protein
MADVQDLFYHGIRQQIRRVLTLLGEERVDKGLTAFEDGASNWSSCFFARAFLPERIYGELDVCRLLNLTSTTTKHGYNVVPVRIVYRTFDGCSTLMTEDELKEFIVSVRDESRPDEVMKLLRSINYKDVESTPVSMEARCAIEQVIKESAIPEGELLPNGQRLGWDQSA